VGSTLPKAGVKAQPERLNCLSPAIHLRFAPHQPPALPSSDSASHHDITAKESSMKIRVLISPVVLAGAFLLTHAAHAKTISTKGNSPTQVQGKCGNSEGGVYFPRNKNGVYACLNADGSGIVCGGKGYNFSKTCDT